MREFNNLFDSVCMVIVWVIHFLLSIIMIIWQIVLKSGTDNLLGTVIGISFMLIILSGMSLIIVTVYFDRWEISNSKISYKKLFRKKVVFSTNDITRIIKFTDKRPSFHRFLMFSAIGSTEAYSVHSGEKKIIIRISKKSKEFLDSYFSQFAVKIEDKTEKYEPLIG